MLFTYGQGQFIEGNTAIKGELALNEHKLFLRDTNGEDLTRTYVPLDKVHLIRKKDGESFEVSIRLTLAYQSTVLFRGDSKRIDELIRDIVQHRGFKKKFLKNEWYGEIV